MIATKTLLSEHMCKICEGEGSWHVMNYGTGEPRVRECGACAGEGIAMVECNDSECDECNPITEEDVICSACGEHSEMRRETGTECCGGGSRFG